ncbi:MAG: EscF/YscF/HrpA family type III secretion system needle major subunit [Endozoicomonas sp.]
MSQPNSQPDTGNLNFNRIQETFGDQAAILDGQLKNRIATMDPNNTKDMVEFQVQFNKYMIVEGLRSSVIKSIKDTLQSIIQKL